MVEVMITKIWLSFFYSCRGIKATFLKERSFRVEVIAIPFLLLSLNFLDISIFRKLIMLATYLMVPCIELINSAIEKLADRLTTEHDLIIQFVKDAASAAVMVCIIFVALIWIGCIWF
jgi:diacylglycerol kinase (ATP)